MRIKDTIEALAGRSLYEDRGGNQSYAAINAECQGWLATSRSSKQQQGGIVPGASGGAWPC